jgi:predicted transglutaminase-like cysteine proteinase
LVPAAAIPKIFGNLARPISACFALSGPRAAGLKQNKSHPAHHRPRNDPVTRWLTSPADARTLGRQMGIFGHSHAWRAIALACGMAWYGPAAQVAAATLISPGAAGLIRKSAEPFGLFASTMSWGAVREKWLGVERKLDDERVQLALCDGDRDRCVSPAALRLLAIVDNARARDGRARLGEINRAINLAIRPMSDLAQYGEIDVWSSPLATFASGAGDCEDYAIAKFAALRLAGVSPDDIRIVIMRDTIHGEDHAVAAARLDGHWLTLDNRRMAMVEDADVRNYRPLFVIDQGGVKQYADAPLLAHLPDRDAAQSVAVDLAMQPGLIPPAN